VNRSANKSLVINRPSALLSLLIPAITCIAGCIGGGGPPVITPSEALLTPGQVLKFSARGRRGRREWFVNDLPRGSSRTGTITRHGFFTAPSAVDQASVQTVVPVSVVVDGAPSREALVSLFLPNNFKPGTVSPTANPLVASYSIAAPKGASVHVQFGPDTNYSRTTWSQPAPAAGGNVTILVAGMRSSSVYHMRAVVQLEDGTQADDADHVFTTGAVPADQLPTITVNRFADMAPRSGIELLSLVYPGTGNQLTAVATDLSGNVIWYYDLGPGGWPFPIKLLPNGHMLLVAINNGTGMSEVREVDLTGAVINRISLNDLNSELTLIGSSLQAVSFTHDILQLPDGHLIFLVQCTKAFNIPGLAPGTQITGDALVDWDTRRRVPVRTWSTFDHIDISHAPFGYPDWTHANAVIYSPDDGNLILSMRNQNWIIKINYRNGLGDGSILWRLGPGGDFILPSGEEPIEWNYGQHYPTLLGPNSAGIFSLMFFNNGNNRLVDGNNTICGSGGAIDCYSSVPIMQLNEYSKTAQVLFDDKLSAYSTCCGNASLLPNGDVEFDVAFDEHTPGVSYIQEVTHDPNPKLLWQMNVSGQVAYRGFRIPSLYPGVQW
jgi:arylsulfate sulfotransferase